MEGALPSVVGGLVAAPVVAVPTSVGYGSALSGFTAGVALVLFAVSATHLASFHSDTDSWWMQLLGHHAAIPLAFAILYQNYRFALGDLPVKEVSRLADRTLVKWIALHTMLPWPKGIVTRPEVDQKIGGTRPIEFERDRAQLLKLMKRFVKPVPSRPNHPIFGKLTESEWQHWGWRHVDHHLRQFGL